MQGKMDEPRSVRVLECALCVCVSMLCMCVCAVFASACVCKLGLNNAKAY